MSKDFIKTLIIIKICISIERFNKLNVKITFKTEIYYSFKKIDCIKSKESLK